MKKGVAVFICVIALSFPSFVLGQFGMGCCPAGAAGTSCYNIGDVKVVPWVGFGYQSQSVNVNFPFNGGLFRGMDIALKNNALWIGSLGLDVAYRQRLRFYGMADTNLFVSNAGNLTTNTDQFVGGETTPTRLSWEGSQQRWWELNLGGLYCLTDDVAILVGFKCDSLTENLGLGRDYRWAADDSTTERLYGDFKVITRSPYIGVKICQSYFDFSLAWSPWLTSYDVNIPLRVFDSRTGDGFLYESYDQPWKLSAGGGQLLDGFAQTKLNIREQLGVNLWLKGSWLQCRGNGNIDPSRYLPLGGGYTRYTGNGSGDAVFTRSLWALGISGSLTF